MTPALLVAGLEIPVSSIGTTENNDDAGDSNIDTDKNDKAGGFAAGSEPINSCGQATWLQVIPVPFSDEVEMATTEEKPDESPVKMTWTKESDGYTLAIIVTARVSIFTLEIKLSGGEGGPNRS